MKTGMSWSAPVRAMSSSRRSNDTLTLSIYAIGNEDAVIPAHTRSRVQNGWEPAACWRFNKDNGGDWEIRVTGTINGREVISHTLFSWTVNKVESETFTAEEGVEGINSWLGGFTPDSLTRYKIYLEPGEFKGVITVPDGMSWKYTDRVTMKT